MANGIILWEGLSQLDDQTPIVAVATYASVNAKTGPMVQTWILRSDISPSEAAYTWGDGAICGEGENRCPFAINAVGERGCYVRVANAPRSIWEAYQREVYPRWDGLTDIVNGRALRIGSYGDPAAIPLHVWATLAGMASGRTGYTHQWRSARVDAYKALMMASCESEADVSEAESRGWRAFYVATTAPRTSMIHCPASKERGKRLTCAECLACGGADSKRRSVWILKH